MMALAGAMLGGAVAAGALVAPWRCVAWAARGSCCATPNGW